MAQTAQENILQFRLVSPEAELMAEQAVDVTIPGAEGEFGVKPGHMALVATLRPGVVTVNCPNNPNPVQYFIAGGFADVNATSCTILAEQAVDVLQLDANMIAHDIAAIKARLGLPMDDVLATEIAGELALAEARLAAAKNR